MVNQLTDRSALIAYSLQLIAERRGEGAKYWEKIGDVPLQDGLNEVLKKWDVSLFSQNIKTNNEKELALEESGLLHGPGKGYLSKLSLTMLDVYLRRDLQHIIKALWAIPEGLHFKSIWEYVCC